MTMFAPPSMDDYLSPIEIFLVREVDMEPRNGRSGYTLGRLYYGAKPKLTGAKCFAQLHGG